MIPFIAGMCLYQACLFILFKQDEGSGWIKSDGESVVNTANDILVWMEGLPKMGSENKK